MVEAFGQAWRTCARSCRVRASNPWPFDEGLPSKDLPHGAVWNTEGWQGSKLDYAGLVSDPDAATKLREYATAVFEIASPTLTA